MKKLTIVFAVAMASVFAGPRPPNPRPAPAPAHHRAPPPPRHHSHSFWGRGGSNFWPGFAGGVVGGIVGTSISAPVVQHPIVVAPNPVPVVVQPRQIWINGQYVDVVQPNGTIVRTWIPGHWETR